LCHPDNERFAAPSLNVETVNEALGSAASFAHISGSNSMKRERKSRQAE
jgi:hypothetical protein